MRVGLNANPNKPLASEVARSLLTLLEGRAEVILTDETQVLLRSDLPGSPLPEIEADVIVSVGGDGTFLATLQRTHLPVLPVNAGTFGFLAEVDGRDAVALGTAIDRLLEGRYFTENRMRLGCRAGERGLPDALNEIVVHTSQVAKMRLFEIEVDGRVVGRLRADGIILATPTGSTSYALSSGGPIVDPTVEAIVMTSLAPFQVTQRAVLLDPMRLVGIRLVEPDKAALVVVDGQDEVPVPGGSRVLAYRSPRNAAIIRFESRFFERMQTHGILPWSAQVPRGLVHADLPPSA